MSHHPRREYLTLQHSRRVLEWRAGFLRKSWWTRLMEALDRAFWP